jgi:hypothetical protein
LIPSGVHTLRYTASNPAAGVNEDVVHQLVFKVEAKAPSIVIDGGLSPRLVSSNPFILEGAISSGSPIVGVDVAGKTVPLSTLNRFSAEVLLMEGANDIPIAVRTEAGHATVESLRLVLDSTPPKVAVTSHQNWQEVSSSNVVLRGSVEVGAHLSYLGQTVESSTDGSFAVPVSLRLGENRITLVATDAAGNRRQLSLVLYSSGDSLSTRTIVLTIGNPAITVNGTTLSIDTNPQVVPVIKSGRALVPVRSIVQALGGDIVWDASTRIVTITLGGKVINLAIGSPTASVDGRPTPIDVDPAVVSLILNDRTMIPLRFVSEQFGASVTWDATTRTITIKR